MRLAKLHWHLWRPGPVTYVRAVSSIVICRVIAAVMAGVAITLYGFLGTVLGNMSYPRWPATRNIENGWAINVATVPAVVQLSSWVPAIVLFSVILVCIPRARIWIFRFAILASIALGFYQRHMPAFPQSAAIQDIARRVEQAASWAQSHLVSVMGSLQAVLAPPAKQQIGWVAPVYASVSLMVVLIAYIFYRSSYILTLRTGNFLPRRPRSHNRSAFYVMSLSRRIMAALVTAGLLLVDLWILQNLHSSLPAMHHGVTLFRYHQIAAIDWVIVAFGAALIICTPRPRGYQWIWMAFLAGITVYAASTHVYLSHLPAYIPPAPQGFWTIVIAWFIATVFCFELVSVLLDWPIYIPPFARSANSPATLT